MEPRRVMCRKVMARQRAELSSLNNDTNHHDEYHAHCNAFGGVLVHLHVSFTALEQQSRDVKGMVEETGLALRVAQLAVVHHVLHAEHAPCRLVMQAAAAQDRRR